VARDASGAQNRRVVRSLPAALLALVAVAAAGSGCRAGARNPDLVRAEAAWVQVSTSAPSPATTTLPPPPAPGRSDADAWFHSFRGKAPPELDAEGTWVNGGPATLASLRGRVVYVQFAFLHCGGCIPMMPFLHAWHRDHAAEGLTVLYVDNAGVDRIDDARRAVRDEHIPFSFFHDTAGRTLRAYGVRAFPTAYVVDRAGKVVWEGQPGGQEAAVEAAIKAALRQ
jgi:thiol-disulfide isomerase/thioredoxin